MRVESKGEMRLKLRRPSYLTALKILSGASSGRDRYNAVRNLKLQYRDGHYNYKYINREQNVQLFSFDWVEVPYVRSGDEIDTTNGESNGLRTIYLKFHPILTDLLKIYISGTAWCYINEVELYNDCK